MSRRLRLALIGVIAVAVVLVVGQVVFPGAKPARTAAAPVAPAVAPAAVVPATVVAVSPATAPAGASTVVAGVPMGFRHDAGGAKAAAGTFAQAYGTLVALDEAGAVAAKRAMATTAVSDALVANMEGKLSALRKVWPVGAVSYRVAPLAVRVRMDGPDAAGADVWYVGVIAAKGIPTYEEWVTETYRLVWERGDWRIAADTEAAGPRPDPGRQSPASAAELEARLVGFEAVG